MGYEMKRKSYKI